MAGRQNIGRSLVLVASWIALTAASAEPVYDVVIRGGTIYDGSGKAPLTGDVAIKDDRIVAVGKIDGKGKSEASASGMAVAPGFINMLSWATESLIADPRSQSDLRQGVTLEVMGEGWSMGPMNATMKVQETERQGDIKYAIEWTSLGDYLTYLEKRGIAPNVASFVGAATVRIHELGEDDVDPTPEQLARMQALVRQAMDEGALGVGSSMIRSSSPFTCSGVIVSTKAMVLAIRAFSSS